MTVEQAYKKVDEIADNLGMLIDKGIKKTVVGLWAHGIETTGSCEGHRSWGESFPWVDVETPPPKDWEDDPKKQARWQKTNERQNKVVNKLLDEFNKKIDFPYALKLMPLGIYGAMRLQTGRTKSIVDTLPPDHLEELQQQMNAFADYLLERMR